MAATIFRGEQAKETVGKGKEAGARAARGEAEADRCGRERGIDGSIRARAGSQRSRREPPLARKGPEYPAQSCRRFGAFGRDLFQATPSRGRIGLLRAAARASALASGDL